MTEGEPLSRREIYRRFAKLYRWPPSVVRTMTPRQQLDLLTEGPETNSRYVECTSMDEARALIEQLRRERHG